VFAERSFNVIASQRVARMKSVRERPRSAAAPIDNGNVRFE